MKVKNKKVAKATKKVSMGIRFKIANFIMKDLLRNNLAVGIKLPLESLMKYHKQHKLDSSTFYTIKKCVNTVDELFKV